MEDNNTITINVINGNSGTSIISFSQEEWHLVKEFVYRAYNFWENWQHNKSQEKNYLKYLALWTKMEKDESRYDKSNIPYIIGAIVNQIGYIVDFPQDTKGKINYDYLESLNFLLKRLEQENFKPRHAGHRPSDFFDNPSNYKGFDLSKIKFTMDKEKDSAKG